MHLRYGIIYMLKGTNANRKKKVEKIKNFQKTLDKRF